MTATVPMSVQDALWLTMDRPNNLMVVDGAMVLDEVPALDRVRTVYLDVVKRFPVFGRRAVPHGLGWAWQDDPDFDIDSHLRMAELPAPADMAALQRFLAEQRSLPLDLDRPLWVAFLVDNLVLPDGTRGSAIVSRFHHAIADGVRLTQVMLGMCDVPAEAAPVTVVRPSAGEPGQGVIRSAAEAARDAVEAATTAAGHGITDAVSRLAHAAVHPVETLAHVPRRVVDAPGSVMHGVEEGFTLLRHPDHLLDALEVWGVQSNRGTNDVSSLTKIALGGSTPTTWTGKPGTNKAVSWCEPIPLDRVKAIGAATGTTLNDVLVAAVAGGVRRYLGERDALVDEVLWMVPVNLKPFADNLPEGLGNYFALVFLPMALEATPGERLGTVHQRMDRIKHSDEAVITFGLQRLVSLSPGQIAFFLTNFFANKAVGVLTNVPGPRGPMSFAGAPVRQVIGFAPCSGDQPMTVTIFSYNGGVTIGFASDADLLPDPEVLVDYVVAELDELESVTTG